MEHDIRLEDIGWQVLKERQIKLQAFTTQAIRSVHAEKSAVALLDLAMGSGRHLMDVLRSMPELDVQAELRDVDPANLEKGRQLANQLGLTRIQFRQSDAFDGNNLNSLDPAPDVVLAAGLFELTADDQRVKEVLGSLAEAMTPGSFLIFTDQPHHPHLEMIGRVAVQRDESPWAMRRRQVEEMRGLVTDAGFTITEQATDEHGLFTVGLAVR